ncbi:MAG TPA: hypothetical protein VMC85_07770 [Desulfomonilaceae bacterium]|nr:hypothetical protein [Desulfomonilaceae bacterium]
MPGPFDNFQSRATKIGDVFSRYCELTLQSIGFILQGKLKIQKLGIEIDQVVRNRAGTLLYFEFKGSSKPPRPGLQRTDTVKKALLNAFLLDKLDIGPYIIITSHKPKEGSASEKMIEAAKAVVFDVICLSDQDDFERLQSYVHVFPWRSRTAAKQQAQMGIPPVAEPVAQQSLFDIGTLHPFTKGKKKREKKTSQHG